MACVDGTAFEVGQQLLASWESAQSLTCKGDAPGQQKSSTPPPSVEKLLQLKGITHLITMMDTTIIGYIKGIYLFSSKKKQFIYYKV